MLWPPLRVWYLSGVAVYLGVTLLATIHYRPLVWLVTWLGVAATHLVYGMRFLQGLCARRMPCEVRRFDHPSEKPNARKA